MQLHSLGYKEKIKLKKKRVGRGPGSGSGKTCGRGTKGQKARSGGGVRPGFEGGQTPIYRRIPKRGFTSINRKDYIVINLYQLNSFAENSIITIDNFIKNNRTNNKRIKILAKGKLDKKICVKVNKISSKAKEIIESLGGTVEVID